MNIKTENLLCSNGHELVSGSGSASASVIRNRQKIHQLLSQLKENHILLSVHFPGFTETFTSMILGINYDTRALKLSTLSPEPGHYHIQQFKFARITAQLHGSTLTFEVKLRDCLSRSEQQYYEMHLPACIDYSQRRVDFRVPVNITFPLELTAKYGQDQRIFRARIQDIGMCGLGMISVSGNHFIEGNRLSCCRMLLPDHEVINFTLEIRYIYQLASGGMRIGTRFSYLDQRSLTIISRLIRRMERFSLSKQFNGDNIERSSETTLQTIPIANS